MDLYGIRSLRILEELNTRTFNSILNTDEKQRKRLILKCDNKINQRRYYRTNNLFSKVLDFKIVFNF
jgi:hypothetical protein